MLTPRWTPMRYHPLQHAWRTSSARFNVVPAGRRSGKTEIAKRKLVERALVGTDFPNARSFAAAPTRDQAKRIFWDDLKALVPPQFIAKVSETELRITLINGSEVFVVGMDKPQRIEGSPWDGGVLDEYGNMRPQAWPENVRPALSDRMGWCDFIGVPEGRNHYYELYTQAEEDQTGEWAAFHWKSADILPPEEIEAAKRDLDELTYQQEYEGSFVNFVGRAYYPFNRADHVSPQEYNPNAPLIFCFDFNVEPGVAVVCQEKDEHTAAIGEVHIPRNSNTPAVCRRLIADWGEHEGSVTVYGDATGGARGTARVSGSDWDLIRQILGAHFDDFSVKLPSDNPAPRARVNAVNARLKATDGTVRFQCDPVCKRLIMDLDGVRLLEGGSGELDKKKDPLLTHISDALGYYIVYEFPIVGREAETASFKWM